MATHFSILAWEIPWTEETGGLQSMGGKELDMTKHSGGSHSKASVYNAGDLGSIPGSGRPLEKEMATHSNTLAWKIPWMEEPGRLQSMGSQRVEHD